MTDKIPAVIVDIDGTIADLTHRLHYVKNGNHDWDKFFAEVNRDKPYLEIIELARCLKYSGKTVLLVSGRPQKTYGATISWLEEHGVPFDGLYMRKDNDFRKDTVVKSEILDELLQKYDIDFTIDDRPSVVKMWRDRGLTCLQCRDWNEEDGKPKGILNIMVGPSGAGKTRHLMYHSGCIQPMIVSTDQLRYELCGDFKDQSKNYAVFAAFHTLIKTRIDHGLTTYADATNIRTKDRKAVVELANGGPVNYIVMDRPLEDKRRDGGWRNELDGFDIIGKHHEVFQSNLKDILRGDGYTNVTVIDVRVS